MTKPFPQITEENAFFWTGGEVGELRFQRCADCRHYIHPPQPICPECLGDRIAPEVVSGRATVACVTVNHHQWHPEFPPPYALAIVEIEEAPYVRLTTRMVDCVPEEVRIGSSAEVVFEQQGPAWLPLFKPATR